MSAPASTPAAPAPAAPAAQPAPSAPPAEAATVAAARLAKEQEVLHRVREKFPAAVQGERIFLEQLYIDIAPEGIRSVLRFLRDDPALDFKMFIEMTCVDYMRFPDYARARFGVTYVLYSLKLDTRIRLKVWVGSGIPEVPTAFDIFGGCNWSEREIFDLYGIRFVGHPFLKRILLPDDYEGHPLRKDYPLKGRGERDSFPVLTRKES